MGSPPASLFPPSVDELDDEEEVAGVVGVAEVEDDDDGAGDGVAVAAGLRATQHTADVSIIDVGYVVPGSSRYGQPSSTRMSKIPRRSVRISRKSAQYCCTSAWVSSSSSALG